MYLIKCEFLNEDNHLKDRTKSSTPILKQFPQIKIHLLLHHCSLSNVAPTWKLNKEITNRHADLEVGGAPEPSALDKLTK